MGREGRTLLGTEGFDEELHELGLEGVDHHVGVGVGGGGPFDGGFAVGVDFGRDGGGVGDAVVVDGVADFGVGVELCGGVHFEEGIEVKG